MGGVGRRKGMENNVGLFYLKNKEFKYGCCVNFF